MAAVISDISNAVVTIKITGRLLESELAAMQHQAAALIRTLGKLRILVLTEAFEGWDRGGDWTDFGLQEQNDPYIEKMAIVGEKRWEDLALLFTCKGLRPFPIEYFTPDRLAAARAWLTARE
jgi:hypothetical protein